MRWLPKLGLVLAAVIVLLPGLAAILPSEIVSRFVSNDGRTQHALGLTLIALLVTASYPSSWPWVLGVGIVASGAVELVQPILGEARSGPTSRPT